MSKPERVFRIGSISASVFKNEQREADKPPFRSVTLQRAYRDGEETKYTSSFTLSDLPNVLTVSQMALDYVAPLEAVSEP